jgi:hypothetical protein
MGKIKWRKWFRRMAPNAAWDFIKWLGGSSVISAIWKAISETYHHSPVDWTLFICLVVFGVVLIGVAVANSRTPEEGNFPETIADLIGKALDERGISKSELATPPVEVPPKPKEAPVDSTPPKAAKFEGEIYRVVSAPKNAFAGMTQQLLKGMGRADDFMLDIDILVEFYIVNVSTETQYIRDLTGSVEIDGHRVALIRQTNFDAWEVNHDEYEYCLDPDPKASKFDMPSRALPLNPLVTSLPTALEPRKPLDGWVRFLLKETNPDKLEGNQTYRFILKDSLGEELNITSASSEKRTTEITARSKRSRRP